LLVRFPGCVGEDPLKEPHLFIVGRILFQLHRPTWLFTGISLGQGGSGDHYQLAKQQREHQQKANPFLFHSSLPNILIDDC
jgi:hypothetical protein